MVAVSRHNISDFPHTILDGHLTDLLFNGSEYKGHKGNVLGAVFVSRAHSFLCGMKGEVNF